MKPMSALRSSLLLTAALLASGCASSVGPDSAERLAITDSLRDRYALGQQELASLQYWVSDTITLSRIASSGNRAVEGGRLVERVGKATDTITIRKDTPGLAVGSGSDWIAVSFEPGSYLYFKNYGNRTSLSGAPGSGHHTLFVDGTSPRGDLVYVNGVAYTASPASVRSHLLVSRAQFARERASAIVQPGRTIQEFQIGR